ncbi:hypothetical protein PPL_10181 [Heterostelium album PN500]|uniref:Cytochrome c oxidase assembly factor 5 n=1 Tax=Heterostelium pallidum (strain ATCC 26659 / Pp 5 / PN500) TaxID=670386 RepID=D3BQJ6_HETP5|nr:hypothetical protein PPL_10181 [Heterostelium album PN500]EFA76416.1 hypothetical protein PPL_10181 [Heterostelium album PN500]|eukprot:XP_020428548.1 hypothetical protein PPL_10181 [Heterostelium album PN500]
MSESVGHPCQQIKDAIVKCIQQSECMKKGKTFHQCMKDDNLDQDCKDLLYTYFKCKVDMFDPRNRFRGNVAAMTWEKESKESSSSSDNNNSNNDNNNNNNNNSNKL